MESIQRERRRQRALEGGFEVVPLSGEGVEATFGVRSASGFTYEVEILSLREQAYRCSCPDFLTNTLGTCKHVEGVLHHLEATRDKDVAAARFARPQSARIYLHRGEDLQVRLLRPRTLSEEMAKVLDPYFDQDGDFIGELWRDFGGLVRAAGALAGVRTEDGEVVGGVRIDPEVHAHVRGLRERAKREAVLARRRREVAEGAELGLTRLPLRPFQRLGALHLAYRERAVLADELGLGKTAQAIAAAELLRRDEGLTRVLVVCPASQKAHWVREIERFAGEAAALARGTPEERRARYRRAATYTVVNYELLLKDGEELDRLRPELLILDEAQRIRNWRSKTAQAVKRIETRYAFVLCDTALENQLDDLYSVMQVVDQRRLGPLWRFNRRFFVLDEKGAVHGYKNLDALRASIEPVFLRRRVADVRDELGGEVSTTYGIDLGEEARARLEVLTGELRKGKPGSKAFARRLGQAFRLIDGLEAEEVPPRAVELLEVLRDALDDFEGRAVAVASTCELRDVVATYLEENAGESRVDLRLLVDAEVPEDPAPEERAEVLVHLDLPLEPAVRARRERLRAGGFTRTLALVAEDTLEEVLAARPDALAALGVAGDRHAPKAGRGDREAWDALLAGPAPAPEVAEGPEPVQSLLFPEAAPPPPADPPKKIPARSGKTRAPVTSVPVPADPAGAAEALAVSLRPVLGDRLVGVERLGTGLVAVVKEDPTRLRGTVRALARGLGLAPVVLDPQTFEDLRPLVAAAGPAVRHTGEGKARSELDKGRAKLSAAHALLEAGMPHEAMGPARRAMEAAARSMLLARGEGPEGDGRLLEAVYGVLVRGGHLTVEEAAGLSRVRDLAEIARHGGADLVDRPLARAILQDARHLLDRARDALDR